MVTFKKEIILSAEPLELGQTVRIQCVRCMDDANTLTVTKKEDGGIVWNCYRASCDERGGHGGSGRRPSDDGHAVPAKVFRPYEGTIRALHEDEAAVLADKVGFTEEHLALSRVRWAPEENRYAFPIWGADKRRRGFVFRTWDSFVRTKALTHMDRDEPHLSWYRERPQRETWIVEDIPSAVRIGLYRNAVALCGTTCGPDYINEISEHTNAVVWALDADATTKAIHFIRKYGALFESSRVQVLERDAKDMTESELRALLEVTCT